MKLDQYLFHKEEVMPANVETMAFIGEVPWHGLGEFIPEKERKNIAKIAERAGLNWNVETSQPLSFQFENKRRKVRMRAMYRSDTGEELDCVGPGYVPFQNAQVLEFFKEYLDTGDMVIETAGSLNGGKQIWALGRMNMSFTLGPNRKPDKTEGYILLMNPHVYGRGMVAKFTAVRVVCWNTLTAALRGEGDSIKLWHNREFDDNMRQEAKERLGIARERMEALEQTANDLAVFPLEEDAVVMLATKHFGGDKIKLSRPATRVIDLFKGQAKGALLPSAKGTAWGFLSAVTQYLDHEYGRTANSRISRSWNGSHDSKKRGVMSDLVAAHAKTK
jgi:phage/plasmid-like protein (TIGR03299 family)